MTLQEWIETEMPHMEGWCTKEKAEKIAELVKEHKPDVCVEIGVFAGRSLFAIAKSLEAYHPAGIAYGIDSWMKESVLEGENSKENNEWWGSLDLEFFYNYTLEHLKNYELEKNCQILRGDSEDFLDQFKDIPIGLLHIDGNHSELTSCRDVSTYVPLVLPGHPIIMDDLNWATTEKAQKLLETMATKVCEIESNGNKFGVYLKNYEKEEMQDKEVR